MLPNEMYTFATSANQTLRVKQSLQAVANGNGDALFPFTLGGVVGVRKLETTRVTIIGIGGIGI